MPGSLPFSCKGARSFANSVQRNQKKFSNPSLTQEKVKLGEDGVQLVTVDRRCSPGTGPSIPFHPPFQTGDPVRGFLEIYKRFEEEM